MGRITFREFEFRTVIIVRDTAPRRPSLTYSDQQECIHQEQSGQSLKLPIGLSCVAPPRFVFTSWKACLSVNRDGLVLSSVDKTKTT
jgi:hypothetical protein